jgi:predicted ATP-grasp superfamily ATP-dependent carboligase
VVVVAERRAPAHVVRGVRSEAVGDAVDEAALAAFFADRAGRWEGAALLPLSDVALRFVAGRYAELGERFQVARLVPEVVHAMLDKRRTLELAIEAGIPAPRQWELTEPGAVATVVSALTFPVIVKPRHTYELVRRSGRKFLWAHDPGGLEAALAAVADLPGGVTISEFVPGPDTRLGSYNAIRHEGRVLGEFTKRVLRRHPTNEGPATLHRMADVPEAAALGRRFFEHVGLEGLGNVEFKLDERDGTWKLIECNHRLTAAAELIQRSGLDVVGALYRQAVGDPVGFGGEPADRWYWYPVNDLRAASAVSRRAVAGWCAMPFRRPVLPYAHLDDPRPSLRHGANELRAALNRRRAG